MYELPLFPLNTVLFPGMPIQLHIFEERYKQMIGLCINQQKPFGVVLIRRGHAEGSILPEPHEVGCTARIRQVQPLWQGRMNILAIGEERYRIVSLNRDKAYLVGTVEPYPLRDLDEARVSSATQQLRTLVERFLQLLVDSGQIRFKTQQRLPGDPLSLAYLAAVLLQLPPAQQRAMLASLVATEGFPGEGGPTFRSFIAQQQALLETTRAPTLLADLCTIYRREVILLDAILAKADQDDLQGSFSDN